VGYELKTQVEPLTVTKLCDQYMKAAEAGAILTRFNRPKKPSTIETDKGRIAWHIKPLLGKMAVIHVDVLICTVRHKVVCLYKSRKAFVQIDKDVLRTTGED